MQETETDVFVGDLPLMNQFCVEWKKNHRFHTSIFVYAYVGTVHVRKLLYTCKQMCIFHSCSPEIICKLNINNIESLWRTPHKIRNKTMFCCK